MRKRVVGRKIAIWVDAGSLNFAIPDVAIDVGGQERIKQKHVNPKRNSDAENQPERAAFLRALRHTRCGKSQQARGNGKGDKRIIATGLKRKRCSQCQACKGHTDAGQRIKRPLIVGEGRWLGRSRHMVTSSPAARMQEAYASPKQGCRPEIASI